MVDKILKIYNAYSMNNLNGKPLNKQLKTLQGFINKHKLAGYDKFLALVNDGKSTDKEIAQHFKLTQSRVSQLKDTFLIKRYQQHPLCAEYYFFLYINEMKILYPEFKNIDYLFKEEILKSDEYASIFSDVDNIQRQLHRLVRTRCGREKDNEMVSMYEHINEKEKEIEDALEQVRKEKERYFSKDSQTHGRYIELAVA